MAPTAFGQVEEEDAVFGEEFLSERDPSILHFLLASGDEISSKQVWPALHSPGCGLAAWVALRAPAVQSASRPNAQQVSRSQACLQVARSRTCLHLVRSCAMT